MQAFCVPPTVGTRPLACGGCHCWRARLPLAWPLLHAVVACPHGCCHRGCGQSVVANPRATVACARPTQRPAWAVGYVTAVVSALCAHAANLDGARNNRARLEGDVLSLTKAVTFLEAKLKDEGEKAVAAYKASRGFKSGLEKMGRVSYEFEDLVTLERLQGKHPDIMIELDPFVECSEDANVEMDLNQPFDDGILFEKQPTL
ncbi:hypothetical protein B296_00028287 [Ensete ventricosum]|uniref:Uncharacterized protein n=1 Tax=Ensete ventricosum TaxID=4639 RepID=A0A426ZN56_ENSVE|nr:hypothetical protein B296_00028287 [Ensete ventricosum]